MSISLILTANANPVTVSGGGGGSLTHGAAFTITGSGFGTRSNYNSGAYSWNGTQHLHFRFKDFRDGVANSNGFYLENGGGAWSPNSTEYDIVSTGAPTNSTYFGRRRLGSNNQESGGLSCDVSGSGSLLYTSFKFRCDPIPEQQSGKFFRAYAGSSKNFYLSTGENPSTPNLYIRGASEGISGGTTEWGNGYQLTGSTWSRVEILANTTTGNVSVWRDGWKAVDKTWVDSTTNWNGHTLDYPNMIDNASRGGTTTGEYCFCDIYVDWTPARVELATSSTWSNVFNRSSPSLRTHEPQIVTSWSDTSITVRVNQGEFAAGTQVWLHVIGADNNPIGSAFGPYTVA